LCSRIKDERNQAGMPGRETNKDPLPSSTVPLGNLLTILKTRVMHINRTPKDMSAGKTGARGFNSRKQFFR
jgi:hypothetical protein